MTPAEKGSARVGRNKTDADTQGRNETHLNHNAPRAEVESRGSGKWGNPSVPKRGWVCVDVEDLGVGEWVVCEMCETQQIRFVHTLEHPDYRERLGCGCICTGHMTGDLDGAREREDGLKRTSGQRSRWLTRRWKESRHGNPYLKTRNGYHVVVYEGCSGRWAFRVTRGEQTLPSEHWYETEASAKLAAFDAMLAFAEVKP
jgi:hypothetical protein